MGSSAAVLASLGPSFLLWCTMPPVMVSIRKELHGRRMSLRKIAAELGVRGHLTACGKPWHGECCAENARMSTAVGRPSSGLSSRGFCPGARPSTRSRMELPSLAS
jgi:hypothetical protein